MTEVAVEQLKAAAKRALEAGDAARAKRFIDEARRVASVVTPPQPDAQGMITLEDGTRMVLDPKTGSYTNAELMAENMQPSLGKALQAGAAQGATFGWGDEAAGALGADPLTVERGRATFSASMRDHPIGYIAGAIGGGVSTARVLARTPGVSQLATRAGASSLLTRTGAGMVTGALLGAAQGAGEANPGTRASGAAMGAVTGAAVGFIAPSIAAAMGSGAKWAIDYLKRTDVKGVQKALKVSGNAARIIKTYLENDDPVAAAKAMRAAGDDAMLADASPAASQLLDSSVAAGGASQQIARVAVEGRSAAASTNLQTAMDNVLGAPAGVKGVANAIAARTSAMRKAAYDRAYSTPIDYAAPEGMAVEEVLSRVPPARLSAAIKAANDSMRAHGVKNQQIMAILADDGTVIMREMPNVQQLDYIKRQLGELAAAEVDQFGRPTAAGRDLSMLATQLKDATGAAVPSYKAAVKLGGDKIAEDKALKTGRDFMSEKLTREQVAMDVKGLSAEARLAAKRGMRAAFDEAMANVKAVASDTNLDARQAVDVVRRFSSDANRAKAELIIGKAEADVLFREFDKASTQLALRTVVARNSATAARTAGKAAMDEIINGGAINALRHGKPVEWTRAMVQLMTRSTPADDIAREQAVYAEIATALTQIRGPQAETALKAIQGAIAGGPISQRQAYEITNLIAKSVAAGAYQSTAPIRAPRQGEQ